MHDAAATDAVPDLRQVGRDLACGLRQIAAGLRAGDDPRRMAAELDRVIRTLDPSYPNRRRTDDKTVR